MKFALILLAVASAFGQAPGTGPLLRINTYNATCSFSLSGAATKMTIQQPASGSKTVRFVIAYIRSDAAITLTQTRNGTAATATTATVQKQPEAATATATAWCASNAGAGTALIEADAVQIPANSPQVLDLTRIQLKGDGTAINYNLGISTATAIGKITIIWEEWE